MEQIFRLGKKIIPKSVFELFQPFYHYLLALIGAIIYGFPSKNMTVIGVTGTKGKTTTSNLIAHILNESGYKTGLATTVNFKIGEKEWPNKYKQTMVGRFRLQKLLSQMKKAGCKYAVIETSSEGILQFRHKFIDYDIGVFTNLSPEHIERHKGFENYRSAKVELFKKIANKRHDSIGVYNLDDEHVMHFVGPNIFKRMGYIIDHHNHQSATAGTRMDYLLRISNIKLSVDHSNFTANQVEYELPLIGEFNIKNAAAAICVALSQKIKEEDIKKALANFHGVSGRMEVINKGQDFSVIVDYAYEPKSLEAVYQTVYSLGLKKEENKMICVFGGTGGGRDKWRRPVMGEIAANYCDKIILTTDDPYEENPADIVDNIKEGIKEESFNLENVLTVIDRREAISKAFSMAKKGDIVMLTGKGGEISMCIGKDEKIPWHERKIAEEELDKIKNR